MATWLRRLTGAWAKYWTRSVKKAWPKTRWWYSHPISGPWLTYNEQGGSAGLLRGGKASTWDGGMREPAIFWWPERIKPSLVHDIGSTLDLCPPSPTSAGATVPDDRAIDGMDISAALLGEWFRVHSGSHDLLPCHARLRGPPGRCYKAHFITRPGYGPAHARDALTIHRYLYHLGHDPSEQYDIAQQHPECD